MPRPPLTLADLRAAFDRVRENKGCAGADGITLQTFAQRLDHHLQTLLAQLRQDTYRPLPLLRIVVEKSPGSKSTRTLLVPAVRDRTLQTAVARALSRSYEEEFLEVSFAYRPGRSVDRAVARLRQLRDLGYEYVLDADIRSFFDNVDWKLLEAQLLAHNEPPWILNLVHAWLRVPAWDGKRLRNRTRGLPQGSPLSPLLANIFLHPLDARLSQNDAKLIRYADDFVVLARDPAALSAAHEQTAATLRELGLELHPEKTSPTSFSAGFRFLGVYFQKNEILTPWKGRGINEPNSGGRLLAMAKPMPPRLLESYLSPSSPSPLASQLQSAGLRWVQTKPNSTSPQPEDSRRVAYLYLTQQGSTLRKSGDRFLVELDGQILLDLPYDKLEHILIFGHVQVTTQALTELLEKGVDLSYFTWRGQFRRSLTPPRSPNIQDRLAQLELWKDAGRSLALARSLVEAKLRNQAEVLRQTAPHAADTKGTDPSASLRAAASASDLNSLMGVEGSAARAYFQIFGARIPAPFTWTNRQPRPAQDPANALLNLTYTLLTQEIAGLLEAEGLEIVLGALHQLDRGRPSLALDLVEPFRAPIADRFVLALLRQGHVAPEDFVPEQGRGVVMTPPALRRYLQAYEHWMLAESRQARAKLPAFRQLLRAEVRKYLLYLRGQADFVPYRFGGSGELPACDISSVTI